MDTKTEPPKEGTVIDEIRVGYEMFIMYVEYIRFIIDELNVEQKGRLYIDSDSLYDLCHGLAIRFSGSEYDDEDVPLCQCITNFLDVAVFDIKKRLLKMNFY